jgi:NADPH-dependent curcumin reductase CurA
VVVSAAAGGVGHVAGQIARTAGARVIGITGSDEKNRKLEAEYGFAHTVNHRSATFVDDLRDACGETGADVFFDNVGGTVLDAMLPLMGHHGRIVCCGAAAQYDDKEDAVLQPGPRGIPQHLFNKALRMEGIFTPDYVSEWAEGARQLAAWLDEGTIEAATHIWNGLDSAPEALVAVLSGENFGQALVRISPDPS